MPRHGDPIFEWHGAEGVVILHNPHDDPTRRVYWSPPRTLTFRGQEMITDDMPRRRGAQDYLVVTRETREAYERLLAQNRRFALAVDDDHPF